MTFARADLVSAATPIEPLPNLSALLGIDLHIKRDDLAGTTMGGNKSRQLEYYLGAAQQKNAQTVLITGAVQSNFVRTAAASAAKLGMKTIVQLEARVPDVDALYGSNGNVLLSRLLGVEVMHYPVGEDEAGADAALRARAEAEEAAGRTPYVIPLALGNPPLGALGYMRAAEEVIHQDPDFDVVVIASGSGLTHAGMLAGLRNAGHSVRVIGSCVRRDAEQQRHRIATVLEALSRLLGSPVPVSHDDIDIWDGALSPGYGRLGPQAAQAMAMMARSEGIVLDPVYTAKVFAAVPAMVKSGEIAAGARVLFVHTGGLASLFAYQSALENAFPHG
ncbi:D-cysteine desulfhydrase family protein [Roseobacter sp. YSTF-M11]|uniref:D-cysteine desulfhydrase family protein n=1 Tax=Roseobacter insulae TaxID=2859783 RepID=A0A9X1K075_9RHOB|nr:D-cysteine desulfhydrase family protein [Roseobacter insulae]MBW4710191.1 D-cysteine desulfhydrase family protein [Roseobacter insulae]